MALYLKMDQQVWVQGDFTSTDALDLSGTVYSDNTFTTVFDMSTFTGTIRLIDRNNGNTIYSTTGGITLNVDGTFVWKPESTVSRVGMMKVRLRLEKTDERITAIGVNGSDELFIEYD